MNAEILDQYEASLMAQRKHTSHWERAVVDHKLEAVLELREMMYELRAVPSEWLKQKEK
jgi:hypothetical protein